MNSVGVEFIDGPLDGKFRVVQANKDGTPMPHVIKVRVVRDYDQYDRTDTLTYVPVLPRIVGRLWQMKLAR